MLSRHIAAALTALSIVVLALSELANVSMLAAAAEPAGSPVAIATPSASLPPGASSSPGVLPSGSPGASASPGASPTATATSNPGASPTATASASPGASPGSSPGTSPTPTPTATPTATATATATATPTATPTVTPTPTPTPTLPPTLVVFGADGQPVQGNSFLCPSVLVMASTGTGPGCRFTVTATGLGPSTINVSAALLSVSSGLEVGKFKLHVVGGGTWGFASLPQVVATESLWPWASAWSFDSTVSWSNLTNVSLSGSVQVVMTIEVAD